MFRLSALLPTRFFAAAWLLSASSSSPNSVRSALLFSVSQTITMESPRKTTEEGDTGIACGPTSFHTRAFEAQEDQNASSRNDGSASEYPHRGRTGGAGEGGQTAKFQMKNDCLLALHRGDITKWSVDGKTDAIVNAANTRMLGGGGVDGAIHRAAGPDLYQACLKLPLVGKNIRCQTGDAVITSGFRLPVSKVIHTAGPQYYNDEKPEALLENCYKNSLFLAEKSGIKYIAFPAISCGIYGYPYDSAAEIAINTVSKHSDGLKEVHFVLFEEESWSEWLEKARTSFERIQE